MSASDARPNVLLICTDHWPGALLGAAGHRQVMTPTLDQMAGNGVLFSNAYSACPVCVPARRALMTGLTSRSHGVANNANAPMPAVTTLAQAFRDAGYQASAVGKLHVNPQRSRIGFDEVILNEEGRRDRTNRADDWELFLADQGHGGLGYAGGMAQNDYLSRPWHLPEHCHPTTWAARQMGRTIYRRDPDRPAFWYLSFVGPHPPLWPLREYLELYRDLPIDDPVIGAWASQRDRLPGVLQARHDEYAVADAPPEQLRLVRRAFYATLTHIDHQIRAVIGTLREQGLIDNTIIAFTSDHGDMLGDHGLWAKCLFYEMSCRVPLIIQPHAGCERLRSGSRDERLAELRDLMPTLLDLAGVPIPAHVEGASLATDEKREYLYGEYGRIPAMATRMIRQGPCKLIYYPQGNLLQLFDVQADPRELHDRIDDASLASTRQALTRRLIDSLYGEDRAWVRDGELIGTAAEPYQREPNRGLHGQRGVRFG